MLVAGGVLQTHAGAAHHHTGAPIELAPAGGRAPVSRAGVPQPVAAPPNARPVPAAAPGRSTQQAPTPKKRARRAHVAGFIDSNLAGAQAASKRWGVPVSVILAQSALESQWGQKVKGNAYFGVKGTRGTAGGLTFGTHEQDAEGMHAVKQTFRAFHNYAEAADDYARLIATSPRYNRLFHNRGSRPG